MQPTKSWCCCIDAIRTVSTWQVQDLCQVDAVVLSCGDDTLCPGSLGFKLIHLLAGVQANIWTACEHPLAGGYRNHNGHNAQTAEEEAGHLETRPGHGAK